MSFRYRDPTTKLWIAGFHPSLQTTTVAESAMTLLEGDEERYAGRLPAGYEKVEGKDFGRFRTTETASAATDQQEDR